MIAAGILAFREGLEAALILGIVLGVVRRVGRVEQVRSVWMGAGLARLVSLAVGVGLVTLGISFEGQAEEIFEGSAMLLAAAVLTWMIFWMGRQGRAVQVELERDVREASSTRGGWALFSLAFVAVLREGVELALFLTTAALTATAGATIVGGLRWWLYDIGAFGILLRLPVNRGVSSSIVTGIPMDTSLYGPRSHSRYS